jgi:hypothetical protein
MNKDEVKGSAKHAKDKQKIGKSPTGDKYAGVAGAAGELDESTKKGLGKTEDKIRDRLKGSATVELDESTKKGLGKTEDKIRDRLKG